GQGIPGAVAQRRDDDCLAKGRRRLLGAGASGGPPVTSWGWGAVEIVAPPPRRSANDVTQLINSIFFAGLYASLAVGLTFVFGVMRLVNLAHGDIMIGAGYLAVFLGAQLGLDPLVALVVIIPAVMLVTYPVQRGLLNPLLAHGEEPPLVATFGLSLIAETV